MTSNTKEYKKEWKAANPEKVREHQRKWRAVNPEYDKEYYLKNKEHKKEFSKEYHLKNREKRLKQMKEHHLKNKEQRNKSMREHYLKTKEHYQEQQKKYHSKPTTKELIRNRVNKKYKTDINFRISKICRSRVYDALKGITKSASTMKLMGCTPDELRKHIESLFQPGMTWENQGAGGWDIDHVKACANFDLINPEQQRACFNWSNLQPLWASDNMSKGAR